MRWPPARAGRAAGRRGGGDRGARVHPRRTRRRALGVGFVPIRKVGKLPHATVGATYELEYGTAEVEVHADAVRPGQRVLLVDDVLATGGTAAAAAGLVRTLRGELVGVAVLLELTALGGRSALPGLPVRSLLRA